MVKIWENPREMICLISYVKPLTLQETCDELYGKDKRNSRLPELRKELEQKEWLQKVKVGNQKYSRYQTTPKCFYDDFIQTLKRHGQKLSNGQQTKLYEFINGDYFRGIIQLLTDKKILPYVKGFSTIREILCYRFILYTVIGRYSYHKFLTNEDITKESIMVADTPVPIVPTDKVFNIIEKLHEKNDLSNKKEMLNTEYHEFKQLGLNLMKDLMYLHDSFSMKILEGMYSSLVRFVEYANIHNESKRNNSPLGNGHGMQ